MSLDKDLRQLQPPPAPRLAIAIIGVLLLGTVVLIALQFLREPVSILRSDEVLQVARESPLEDLMVYSQGDVTVYMPANSIDQEGSIYISAVEQEQVLIADDEEWVRPSIVNIEFLNEEGTPVPEISFFHPVEICFALTPEQWESLNENPGRYQVQYFAERGTPPRWEILPKLAYPDRQQLCGQTFHLSVFALAIQVVPEIPVTGPTATPTPTATSTRVIVPPKPTRERDPDPTSVPPSPTSPPPTQLPTQPPTQEPTSQPTQPPPTQEPTQPPSTPEPTGEPTDEPTQPPFLSLPSPNGAQAF